MQDYMILCMRIIVIHRSVLDESPVIKTAYHYCCY